MFMYVSFPYLLLLAAFIPFLFFLFPRKNTTNPRRQPTGLPGPWGLPVIGNLHQLGLLPHHSLRSLSRKYGSVMLLRFGLVPIVIVSSAAAAEDVLKTHDSVLADRPDSTLFDRLFYGSRDLAVSKYGDYWRNMRRVCLLHLLSVRRIRSFRTVREEEVALLVDRIRAVSPSGPVNVSEMVITLTNDFVCRVAFGGKLRLEEVEGIGRTSMRELFSEFTSALGEFPLRDFVPWFGWMDWVTGLDSRLNKTAKKIDAIMEKVVEVHDRSKTDTEKKEDAAMDFVDILLSLEAIEGTALSRDSIKAMILDVFAAGSDSTYVLVEWAMAELIKHPTKMKRIQEEVRGRIGSRDEFGEDAIEGMEYLRAVIKETLRVHPPNPLLVPREAMEDAQVQGHIISKGTRLTINAWAIGRDPMSWEEPEEFCPERFLEKSAAVDFRGQHFELIPFGAGRRGCPGISFALAIAELVLANLLYHFDWELPSGRRPEEMDMSEELCGVTLHKKSPLLLVAKLPK